MGWSGGYIQQSSVQSSYSGMFCEQYSASGALDDAKESQILSGLPKGKYRLSISASAQWANLANPPATITGAYIFAGDQKESVSTMQDYSVDFMATGTNVEIGFKTESTTANWVSFDNVRLYYLGNDVSSKITNPNFDSNADGWTNAGTWGEKEVEFYNTAGGFDMYQDLTGLDAGIYAVELQGFYRNGVGIDEKRANAQESLLASIYAKGEDDVERSTSLLSIYEEAGKRTASGSLFGDIPNLMDQAQDFISAGYYKDNKVIVEVGGSGTLRIGAKKDGGVGADWTILDNFSLTKLDYSTLTDAYAAEWITRKTSGQALLNSSDYSNIISGSTHRTALSSAVSATPSDLAGYISALAALRTAVNNFKAAKYAYDNFATAKAIECSELPYASSTKFEDFATAQAATPTSASDAIDKTAAIISAYRLYVESNAMAEGIDGAEDKTSLISDPNLDVTIESMTAGGWTFTQGGGSAGILDGERLAPGDGTTVYKYFDYYNSDNNNQHLYQTISSLPAGQYLLTVSARAASNFKDYFYLSVKDGDADAQKENIPAIGNSGGVFGRGWNDVSMAFVHKTDGNVEVKVYSDGGSGSGKRSGWWGATRFRLVRLGDATVTAKIGSTGWTTFASSEALNLSGMTASTGTVTAYYASAVGDASVTMTATNQAAVAAGVGIMLKGTPDAIITIPIEPSGTAIANNKLVGCTSETILAANSNYYVLVNNNGTAEFQCLDVHGATIPAGKAYLNVDSSSARSLRMVFADDITGIGEVEDTEAVAKDGKFIKDGKLVIFKNGVKYNANGSRVK